jgi:hypothetical protein
VKVANSDLDRLCRIPLERAGWRSLARLIREAEYSRLKPWLSQSSVASFLQANERYVTAWEDYSSDKRTSGGWYLQRTARWWRVGRLSHPTEDRYFADGAEACGAYILREVEYWSPRWPWQRLRWQTAPDGGLPASEI